MKLFKIWVLSSILFVMLTGLGDGIGQRIPNEHIYNITPVNTPFEYLRSLIRLYGGPH